MTIVIWTYIIGGIVCFAYLSFEEIRSFVGEHKLSLLMGLVASIFWPILLAIIIGDYVTDWLERKGEKKNRTS